VASSADETTKSRQERSSRVNPQTQFCHNLECPARGKIGDGNIRIFSQQQQRYDCKVCGKTFTATTGTPFYRLRTAADVVTLVLTLLVHGCPAQAIVAAFGFDERTVADWQQRAGRHAQQVHEHIVEQGQVDLQHVQADELWVKLVGRRVWMAMAMAVPSRLWLGGVISPTRDKALIGALVQRVRRAALSTAILVCVDGLASYASAFPAAFRHAIRTGRRGRPRLVLAAGFQLAQVVKRYTQRRVASVTHRVVHGTMAAITAVLCATSTGATINTAYIERLNATFRSRLSCLTRRGRAIARTQALVTAGMWLVGGSYNFCTYHASLRERAPTGAYYKWEERTPAMAAGLTDHRWTLKELLLYQVPPPAWVAPTRRGRPPQGTAPPSAGVAT
jgi:transposase-like protein